MIILNQDLSSRDVEIVPFKSLSEERIAFDLRIGSSYQEPGDANHYPLSDPYKLKPGHCILVTTKETLSLPSNVFGQICSKGSLAAIGLFVGNTKVDPCFSGHLRIPVFNASNKPIEIKADSRFCSVFFHTIEHCVADMSRRQAPDMPCQSRNRVKDFFAVHKADILTVILSGITAFAATYATMH